MFQKAIQDEVSQSWSVAAPVRGWNARDALAMMQETDAIQLDNWFPSTTDVGLRSGSVTLATLPAGQVIKTLLGVAKGDGTYVRFAASQGGFYNVTPGGAIAAPAEVTSTGTWQHVQINVGGISYMWACAGDGTNKVRLYNSTANTWLAMDGASAPVLTGPTSTQVANVSLWKYRLILCEAGTMKFWYGPLNSVGGVFNAFDLGQVFKKGGYLMATGNWTVDAGDGPDDRFVAVSSEGEIAIYQGTDPSALATFSLVGVYDVGRPIGRRCLLTMAGDVGVLTEQGMWPLSKALLSSTIDKRGALTDRIQSAFNAYYKLYGTNSGWQAVLLPKGPAVVVNVPLGGSVSYQFVMNNITGAWSRFKNWNAEAMLVLQGRLFIAANNVVKEAWTGTDDDGDAITAVAAQAANYAPSTRRGKHVKLVRPIMQTTATLRLAMRINSNFALPTGMAPDLTVPSAGALWDSAVFGTAAWGGETKVQQVWKSVVHTPGRAYSLQLGIQAKGVACSWVSTDFIGESCRLSLT